ncbi:acyltransferase [Winogradskyella costae]|uniref:acyltransferase n=1 Tax=Winogradskyella costae TaxID=2697008 RepID=UPI0015C933F4|nr:hypothetical protein [Winogradskyella costae]
MIVVKYLKFKINRIFRYLYWLYRLTKIDFGKNVLLHFPIKCEGKGGISIGSDSEIYGPLQLKVQNGSVLKIGKGVQIHKNVQISVSNNSTFVIEDYSRIESNSRIFINKDSKIGKDSFIASDVSIFSREGLKAAIFIGEGCGVGNGTILDVSADIEIGDKVAIGPNCTIYTHDHDYTDINVPAWKGELLKGEVVIGSNSWIGSSVTILHSVRIGEGSIVGSGSMVNKSIPEMELWAGTPAKKLKSRV